MTNLTENKYFKWFLGAVLLTSCNKPDFYKDGVAYQINETCIEEHTERYTTIEYNLLLKMNVARVHTNTICDKYRIDTLICDTLNN